MAGCLDEAERLITKTIENEGNERRTVVLKILDMGSRLGNDKRRNPLKRHAAALRCFETALKINPEKIWERAIKDYIVDACFNIGQVYYNLGRWNEAEKVFTKALNFRPDNPILHCELGNTLKQLNRSEEAEKKLEEAEKKLEEAVRLNPDDYVDKHNLGLVLLRLGKLTKAEETFIEVTRLNPNCAEAFRELGITLHELGRDDEAEKAFGKAIELEPDDPLNFLNLGNVFADLDEAEKAYRKAIELNKDFWEAYWNLGQICIEQGRLDKAERHFRKVLKLKPDEGSAHRKLGYVLLETDRMTEAFTEYVKAFEINPEEDITHYHIGVISHYRGDLKQAERAFKNSIRLSNDPYLLGMANGNLGKVLFYKGEFDQAKSCFRVSQENFHHANKDEDATVAGAYITRIDGFMTWQADQLSSAEKYYASAAKQFQAAGRGKIGTILLFLSKCIRLDKELVDLLNRTRLKALKKGISRLSAKMAKALQSVEAYKMREVELLQAKVACVDLLARSLRFDKFQFEELEKVRKIFRKHGFVESLRGANALDNFMTELNQYDSLEDVIEAEQEKLLELLKPVQFLDGLTTRLFEQRIAVLQQELFPVVTDPLLKEVKRTRESLTRQMRKIHRTIEVVHSDVSEIKSEISIRKVAQGEFEIAIPVGPNLLYKMHFYTGEIDLADLIRAKEVIYNKLENMLTQVKKISYSLYRKLNVAKHDIAEKIFLKLREYLRN